jgi:23S rRNA (uracil1939-C5)-methyltransferase
LSPQWQAELMQVPQAFPEREPACRHFGVCGGCTAQHLAEQSYVAWKAKTPVAALRAAGVTPAHILPMIGTEPGMRRRADFTLRHTARGVLAGFARRRSHEIVDLVECPVLMPELVRLVPRLRALAATVLPQGKSAEAVVNWTDAGADVLLVPGERLVLDLDRRTALADFAEAADVARLSWGQRWSAETVVTRRVPRLGLGQVEVEPPPGAFLQATIPSEAALRTAVRIWLADAGRIVDLYAGIGTLSLGLIPRCRITLVEGDRAAVAAVQAALRKAGFEGTASAHVRNLAADPLRAAELEEFDAAIFDPPRAGAPTQAAEMARSRLPAIIAVSCDPRSFARDARTLVDGGYRLEQLLPVDQFLWSSHVELAALFRR